MAGSWTPKGDEFARIDRGYVVKTPDFRPDAGGEAINGANAYLEDLDGNRVWLWVNDISSDFSMVGSTGQSKKRRTFFPHNFAQPSVNISGQTPNQYQYNRLAEFVRKSQTDVILHDQRVLKFRCIATPENTIRPIVKGGFQSIALDGYVKAMPRLAERWVNAPPYSFDFIVTYAIKLLELDDTPVRRVKFKSILSIIKHPGTYTFEEGGVYDPDKPAGQDHSNGNDTPIVDGWSGNQTIDRDR
jgi:hypothetical protein